ncbi:M24 family metallopeptidase [Enterococcus thailandicus]|uniref:Peptidase M24 n=2 Tax=root TaxID=1 RepID=A0A510WBA6_ENTTH|nr:MULTISPECIES: Xaa-Pro peptidase family protein [Enterococcus]MDK4351707.1 Xaa-Pro peptidase family protein [Enterococcus thailandicus]MDT2734360.1 Xaa-Pro peptidase family protein [Enterococcus thailandicus]MDT2752365.1 Xaa-Pro peptidase family protein [Enterococcus thailandicus]MDT2776860.1 Xaa-Pro peptidase family protein [Enterococcus thailandicus]MDT2793270.1 Xaa-Pro peptidase family protein [Enterococcus thailandicus]
MMVRVEKLRKKMQEENLDSFLVTSPYNLRYLTNFTGTTGLAVITLDKAFFITDFRYTEQAANQAQGFEIIKNVGPIFDEVADLVKRENLNALAFEETTVSFLEYSVLEEIINAELIPVSGMIEELREVKDEEEIAIIEKACSIADMAYDHILKMIRPGMTEIEVANQVDFYMRSLGATSVSFDTIVASGLRSAMPHGVASEKVIEQGDLITLDFGCYYQGYVSDMTRTFAIGDPGEKLKEIYQIVLDAQLAVLDAAKPGLTGIQLDAVARDYITKYGYGEAFGHSTGHGIGLEIHEGPNVSSRAEKQFVPGNVITDEPGIYLPGIGGVRIEDDLLITKEGNRVLTHSPKELIIL